MDYMNGMMNPQQFNPATMTQIPYKPVTFEKLSNLIGMTYNLSSIENMNTVALPRGGEQQIFFVNNDERIYISKKKDFVEGRRLFHKTDSVCFEARTQKRYHTPRYKASKYSIKW